MSALNDLQAAVAANTAAVNAAIAALGSHTDDSAALAALTATINADQARLSAAVAAATPVAPAA